MLKGALMSKKAIRKLIGSILLSASLVVAAIPVNTSVALTASTTDFELNGDILVKYSGTAITVSIPDTVKVIGEGAFADNGAIYTVNIPSTVEKISYAAFSGCNHLAKINIPDSVEEIGTAAFCNCTDLTDVKIGNGLKKLGAGAFTGCNSLSDVTFGAAAKYYCKDGVIYDNHSEILVEMLGGREAKAYSMPNTITKISQYAFYGCKNLESVTISSVLNEIPAYSFSNCVSLNKVYIPYSVNYIQMKAFENCVHLSDVEIPESVTSIHNTAFDGCPRLNVIAPEFTYPYYWFKNLDRSAVTIIDEEDNSEPEPEEEEETEDGKQPVKQEPIDGLIGETVVVGHQAVFFINNTSLEVHDPLSEEAQSVLDDMTAVLQTETNGKGVNLPKFAVIGDKIAGKAFYDDKTIKDYVVADGITEIGDFAFARSSITSITIPESVTTIGYGAFYHCDDLVNVLVPATVTKIEPSAFAKTKFMDYWKEYGESAFLIMGDGILVAYKGNGSRLTIPDTVKQIGPEVFMNHTEISEVTIPESCTKICESAFEGCSGLKVVKGGMKLSVIEDRAFSGCPLNTVRIVDTVTTIGLGAFDLSNTNLPADKRVVVFHGDTIPKASYVKTSTRLTNEDYRVDSLNGVKVAIVSNEMVNRVGTVLDREYSGFSGLVCVIQSEQNEYFNGTLHIIDCTLTKEEAQSFSVPDSILIYDKGYNFIADELSSVLGMAREGSFGMVSTAPDNTPDNTQATASDYVDELGRVYDLASFEGSDSLYRLYISKDDSKVESFKQAYTRIYSESIPLNLTTYSISVYEDGNKVPLSKFGKQVLPVNIELPDNLPTANLHVICLDEYGQLEDLPFKVVGVNGKLCVNFEISHTGEYGLYSYNSSALLPQDLDSSPDTGDPIHPKWFLSAGLLLAALGFFIYKDRPIA